MSAHDEKSNASQTARELDRLFSPGAEPAGQDGYRAEDGRPRAIRGDDEAPHLKVPPFATVPTLWTAGFAVPLAPADYEVAGDALDCTQQRLLQIYFDLEIIDGGDEIAHLSLIPEGSAADEFYVVGVVDLTVSAVNLASARFPFGPGSFGSRTFYPSELRTPQFAGVGHIRFILAFDVSPFESFRLNARDLVGSGGNLLTTRTSFAQ